jgi:hypothetical protein
MAAMVAANNKGGLMDSLTNIELESGTLLLVIYLAMEINRRLDVLEAAIKAPTAQKGSETLEAQDTPESVASEPEDALTAEASKETLKVALDALIAHEVTEASTPVPEAQEQPIPAITDIVQEAHGHPTSFVEREMIRRAEAQQDRSR